jgi:hypothetical protein
MESNTYTNAFSSEPVAIPMARDMFVRGSQIE